MTLLLSRDVMGVSLIRNDATSNHFQELRAQLRTALELHMVVAFVSEQGARLLLELLSECTASIFLCTSLERMVSEPSGFELLQEYASTSGGRLQVEVVTNRGEKGFSHSKLYHFRHKDFHVTMIGSANLSRGGLVENEELSTLITHAAHGDFEKNISKMIGETRNFAAPLTPDLISNYKSEYENAQSGKYHYEIDAERRQVLKKKLHTMPPGEGTKWRVLKIQMVQFVDFGVGRKIPESLRGHFPWLDEAHLPVVRTIQHHQRLDPENLWKLAISTDVRQPNPIGKEAVTSIMHLYQPRRFAPVSEHFLQLLRKRLGLNPVPFEEFSSYDYQRLCKTLGALRLELKLKNIGAIECLLNHIT